ncbi:MAG: PEGA domain-containing protein [Myxococcales bacterium]|nr:PEGA domain-containing protein [Myxococcales bacterium]
MGVDPTPAPGAGAPARPDLVPDPSALLTEEDLRIKKPRSYTGLLMLLLIAVGAFGLYRVMQEDISNPRTRGNPNIQVAPPSLQDLTKGSEDVELPPPPKKAMLRLESDPPGARVVVNGNVVSSVTPTAVQTFVGRFADVRMMMPGRLPQGTRVKVDEDEVEVKLALEEGVPPSGSLYVETAPAGAELSLNGNAVGITPIKLPKVAANTEMTLALRKEGYYPHVVTYTLAEGEERDLGIRLIQDTGPRSIAVVNVESIPLGAEVTELRDDGENKVRGRTGRYPVKLNVPIDRPLHLRAEAERHAPAEAFLDVREPFYTLYLRLPAPEAFHGKLSIIGAKGLTVFVGSEEVGATPVRDYELTEGDHTIVVFDEKSRVRKTFDVRIDRNKTLEKSVVLEGDTISVH